MSLITSQGTVERFADGLGVGTMKSLSLTTLGSLRVAQVENPNIETARSGKRFAGGCQVIASGVAPVTAIPTTTATIGLYNTDSAVSLAIDQVGFYLGSGTPTVGATLLLALSNGPLLAANIPTALANYSSQALGKAVNSSVARWGAAVVFPAGSAWFQATSTLQLAGANVGMGDQVALLGSLVIPPMYCLGMAILSGAGTVPLYSLSVIWSELRLDLE